MSPRRNWDPPPLPQASVPSPRTKWWGGGHTRQRLKGWGSPNSDDWRKGLALCLYHRERIWKTSTLSCMKKRRKSPSLPQDEGAPPLFWGLAQNEGAPPFYEGAPPLFWVLSKTNKHSSTFQISPPPTCLQHQLIPPPPLYLGQGGTMYPSTPF
jgi:hypothetical protein